MSSNPLQKHFRQPKIYISLPSKGVYNSPGSLEGKVEDIPVMSMTGMDELMLKTPDALINGEATVQVIQSCCPTIKDAWEVSNLDLDVLLVAIRIATYGSDMEITAVCANCGTQNNYTANLNDAVEHFTRCTYDNKLVLKDLTVMIKPLSYRQVTKFNLKNFELRRQLNQLVQLDDEEVKNKGIAELYAELGKIQNETYIDSIESVQTADINVNEAEYIREWIVNADKATFDSLKSQIEKNNAAWAVPKMHVQCENCQHEDDIAVEMDQANFFVQN